MACSRIDQVRSIVKAGAAMILETIVTTINEDNSTNVSPMGPTVMLDAGGNPQIEQFELRPFNTSRTFANLKRTKMGVMHITDDAELFARAAVGELLDVPPVRPAETVTGSILIGACRSYEFKVEFIDETGPRMSLNCRAVQAHRQRDFLGFNRAKHAVIEAAILATRLDFLPAEEVQEQFVRLNTIVQKTSGPSELAAMNLLNDFVQRESQSRA